MAYTQAQLQSMLDEVQAAISKALTAVEYQAGAGMSLRRASLKELQEREKWLLDELAKLDGTGTGNAFPVNRVEFGRPV
jgi:hypothetical protein